MLGSGKYSTTITDRAGALVAHIPGDKIKSGSWGRTLSDTSQAEVVAAGVDAGRVEPWAHTLTHYRDGQRVWRGPVYSATTVGVTSTIIARDPTARWARRVARVAMDYTGMDVARVAQLMLFAEMSRDDPDEMLQHLMAANAGTQGQIRIDPAAPGYIADAITVLVDAGLTYTVVGGRLVLGRVVHFDRLPRLVDKDFVTRLPITTDGALTVTDATIVGKGVVGRWRTDTPATGAVERIEKRDALTTVEQCVDAARALVESGHITPKVVSLPQTARLSPESSVSVEQLVPGITVPIGTRAGGVLAQAELELHGVDVSFGAGTEAVSITAGKAVATTPATPSGTDTAKAQGTQVAEGDEPEGFEFTQTQGFPPWWIEGPGIELPNWFVPSWATGIAQGAIDSLGKAITGQSGGGR